MKGEVTIALQDKSDRMLNGEGRCDTPTFHAQDHNCEIRSMDTLVTALHTLANVAFSCNAKQDYRCASRHSHQKGVAIAPEDKVRKVGHLYFPVNISNHRIWYVDKNKQLL